MFYMVLWWLHNPGEGEGGAGEVALTFTCLWRKKHKLIGSNTDNIAYTTISIPNRTRITLGCYHIA